MYSIYDVEGPYWNCKTDLLIRQIDEDLKKGGQTMAGIRNDVIDTGYIPVEYNTYKELVKKANKWDEHERKTKELELERYINKLISGEVVYPFKDRLLLVESTLVEAIKNGMFFDFSNVKSKLHYSILTYLQGTDDRFFKWETGTVDALTFSVFHDGASDLYRWQSEINEIIEHIPWKNAIEKRVIFDTAIATAMKYEPERELVICELKSAERFLNDKMKAEKRDLNMSDLRKALGSTLLSVLWMDKGCLDNIFKYSNPPYVSFGFDPDNINDFRNKKTDQLVMNFNWVPKEESDE